MIKDFIYNHEPLWLFIILVAGLLIELHSNYMLRKEYDYDKEKDEKKQRRTKTTKKTTSKAGGESIVEESVEVSEPVSENKHERNEPKI